MSSRARGGSTGRAPALVFAREGAPVVGCDLSVGVAQASVELLRGTGGEMVSKQLRHLTEPADCQALVDLAPGSLAGSTRCSTPAATAYLNRLDDINDEEADPAPATRSTSSGGMKGVVACGGR